MTTPTSVIINAVFLAVYALLFSFTLFNVFKHGHSRQFGYISLLIFCVARLVGNALLIAAYKDNYSSKDILEGGFILEGLGYAFLFSASLAFYVKATSDSSESTSSRGMLGLLSMLRTGNRSNSSSSSSSKAALPQILHLVNTVALILLIVGYIKSKDLFALQGSSTATLDSLAKVGNVLFLIITIVLAGLTAQGLMHHSHNHHDNTRFILFAIVLALPFMLLRSIFVTYQAFTVDPFQHHLVLRAVLQYASEAIIVIIYTIMGLSLLRRNINTDMELAYKNSSQIQNREDHSAMGADRA